MKCIDRKPCDFSESDLLALTTLITKEIAKIVKDIDTLSMIGDVIVAIGDNITMLASQRDRCAQTTKTSTTS